MFLDGPFLSDLLPVLLSFELSLRFFFSLSRLFLFGQNDIRDGGRRSARENEDEGCTRRNTAHRSTGIPKMRCTRWCPHSDSFLRNSKRTLTRVPPFVPFFIVFLFPSPPLPPLFFFCFVFPLVSRRRDYFVFFFYFLLRRDIEINIYFI